MHHLILKHTFILTVALFHSFSAVADGPVGGTTTGLGLAALGGSLYLKSSGLRGIHDIAEIFNPVYGEPTEIANWKKLHGGQGLVLSYMETPAEARTRALQRNIQEVDAIRARITKGDQGFNGTLKFLETEYQNLLNEKTEVHPQRIVQYMRYPENVSDGTLQSIQTRLAEIERSHPGATVRSLAQNDFSRLQSSLAKLKLYPKMGVAGVFLTIAGGTWLYLDSAHAAETPVSNSTISTIVAPRLGRH